MSRSRSADNFPNLFVDNTYTLGTSLWDQFDREAKESAAAKWLFELARASEQHGILEGWGSMKTRDVSCLNKQFGLECIDDMTRIDRNHLTPGYRPSNYPKIVHVQLNLGTMNGASTRGSPIVPVSYEARQQHWQILKRLINPLAIDPDFILGHFLPALASDPPLSWKGKQLLFTPPIPSRQRCIRLRKHDGTRMSIKFRAISDSMRVDHGFFSLVGVKKVILIVEDCLTSPAEHPDCFPAKDHRGRDDSLGYIKPYVDQVIRSFIQDLQTLAIQLRGADELTELEQQATDARERLLYCKHNLIENRRWLPDLTYALELVDILRNEVSHKKYRQTQDLQLKSAIEADSNAKEANQLAERAGKLGVLAFIFIPLSFVTSLFSMNITPLREPVSLWYFLAVALPFELLTVMLFFGTVTWGSVRKGNDRAKRAMSWRPAAAKQTTQTV